MKTEAIFYRLQKMYEQKLSTLQIKSVDFVVYSNDFPLKVRFEEKKMELGKVNLTEEILAFHGTNILNADSILNLNLDHIALRSTGFDMEEDVIFPNSLILAENAEKF